VVDRAEAEDVAQEVFLDFHRHHSPTAPYAAAWLHRAAWHTALNRIRGRRRPVVAGGADEDDLGQVAGEFAFDVVADLLRGPVVVVVEFDGDEQMHGTGHSELPFLQQGTGSGVQDCSQAGGAAGGAG